MTCGVGSAVRVGAGGDEFDFTFGVGQERATPRGRVLLADRLGGSVSSDVERRQRGARIDGDDHLEDELVAHTDLSLGIERHVDRERGRLIGVVTAVDHDDHDQIRFGRARRVACATLHVIDAGLPRSPAIRPHLFVRLDADDRVAVGLDRRGVDRRAVRRTCGQNDDR